MITSIPLSLSTATSKGAPTTEGGGDTNEQGGMHNAPPGSKYRLPMWVAEALRQPGLASVGLPEMLNSRSFKEFSQVFPFVFVNVVVSEDAFKPFSKHFASPRVDRFGMRPQPGP